MLLRFACAFLCLVSLAACVSARSYDPTTLAEGILQGRIDPADLDFSGWAFEPNNDARAALEARIKSVVDSGKAFCSSEVLYALAAMPWVGLAAHSPDESNWREARSALKARFVELEQAAAGLAQGRETSDPRVRNPAIDFILGTIAAERNPRARELHGRVIVDQHYRFAGSQWQVGLPKAASDQWGAGIGARIWRVSCENTAWMHAQLTEIDWFTIPVYGEQADAAAWVLVQHADFDRPFQREVLKRLQRLAPSGATAGRNVAYLFDRLAIADGHPQRYGTQVQCKDGKHEIMGGVESPDHLDTRRTALGLPTWATYVGKLGKCG